MQVNLFVDLWSLFYKSSIFSGQSLVLYCCGQSWTRYFVSGVQLQRTFGSKLTTNGRVNDIVLFPAAHQAERFLIMASL